MTSIPVPNKKLMAELAAPRCPAPGAIGIREMLVREFHRQSALLGIPTLRGCEADWFRRSEPDTWMMLMIWPGDHGGHQIAATWKPARNSLEIEARSPQVRAAMTRQLGGWNDRSLGSFVSLAFGTKLPGSPED